MESEYRDDSPHSEGDNTSNNINVSDSYPYHTDGKFDKEKFYKYLKEKQKSKDFGPIGIENKIAFMVLKDNEKDKWNYKMKKRRV